MKAYVLLAVPALRSGGLVEGLRKMPGVVKAHAIYGDMDIIAELEVPDIKALDSLVMDTIQKLPWVQTSRTFIVVDSI